MSNFGAEKYPMSKDIRIKRGLDIRLKGSAEKVLSQAPVLGVYAVQPTDFTGITPKLLVKEGEHVLAGAPLFYSKDDERVRFSSPVSGEIAAIVRGAKESYWPFTFSRTRSRSSPNSSVRTEATEKP